MGDTPSFLGVPIGDNAPWLREIDKGRCKVRIIERTKWWLSDSVDKEELYLVENLYPGPFNSKPDAEAWITWATHQLS